MNTIILQQFPSATATEVLEALACFDYCTVLFYNGKYHVTVNSSISDQYADDFRVICTLKNSDVYNEQEMKDNYNAL